MNEASKHIDLLWEGVSGFQELRQRLETCIGDMSPLIAGIIGKELAVRNQALSTPAFALAAYLASEGEAGNDSLLDFMDCVSILPFERYSRISHDHDSLINDPVRTDFDELGFYSLFEKRFDSAFGAEGEGFLSYLVFAESDAEPPKDSGIDPKAAFPQRFARFGHVFNRKPRMLDREDRVTLDTFFGSPGNPDQ